MRIGIIDLGTNSVRFDIQWIDSSREARLLHREKIMVRLGHGVFLRQRLDPAAKRRTIDALQSFRRAASRFRVTKMVAFGTSALRDAIDGEAFVEQVKKRTGIEIRVISGEEEARLIAIGILHHEKTPPGLFGLIDMGGGSTELSLCKNSTLLQSCSLQLGTARLQQVFLKSHPPGISKAEQLSAIENLRQEIHSTVESQLSKQTWPKVGTLIGSSGTIRSIEKVLKRLYHSDGISRLSLQKLIDKMIGLSRAELIKIPGMESKRVDMILAGAILLDELMEFTGALHVTTTRFSLRDGIVDREVLILSDTSNIESRFQIEELYQKASQFGLSRATLQARVRTAEEVFEKTKKLHQLDHDWLRYLSAGIILHEIGAAVSPTHFEAHSYYIVRHADFLAMETWETEWIAQLCLNANLSALSKKDLSFITEKKKRPIFLRLLALMRICEGLGGSKPSQSKIKQISIGRNSVKLVLTVRSSNGLAALRVQQRKDLFERTFKMKLQVD